MGGKMNKIDISAKPGRRKFNNVYVDHNGKIVIKERTENQHRKDLYKKAINRCCMPDCKGKSNNYEVHHIVPRAKMGTDTFDNYLVLCDVCHRKSRIHSRSVEKRIELLVYKFYMELQKLGFSSDSLSEEEFLIRLKSFVIENEDNRLEENDKLAKELARRLSNRAHKFYDDTRE